MDKFGLSFLRVVGRYVQFIKAVEISCFFTAAKEVVLPDQKTKAVSKENWITFLASTRLAIYLLIGIAIACVAGIFLPQKGVTLQPDAYMRLVANPFWNALDRLGFLDVFRSVWFFVLVAMMSINLILCTYKGIVRVQKRVARSPEMLTKDQAVHQGFHRIWKQVSIKYGDLETILRPLHMEKKKTSDGSIAFKSDKGSLFLFAPFIIHGSILLMILGAMVDLFSGLDARMNIPEGHGSDVISVFSSQKGVQKFRLPFVVRCDDFDLEFYEGTNRPKDYRSTLTIVENDNEVFSKTIEVNDPLNWKGFRLFQSSYGKMQSQIEIEVTRKMDGQTQRLLLSPMETNEVPPFKTKIDQDQQKDSDTVPGLLGVALLDMKDNFQGHGSAVKISILREDGNPEPFWLFLDSPDYDELRKGPYRFRLIGQKSVYYTGLMVVKKPGAVFIWIGCTLFMFALSGGYFVSHRRVWLSYRDGEIVFAGTANRSKEAWNGRLEKIADRLERAMDQIDDRVS